MWLTRAALANPIAVTLFYVALAVLGGFAMINMGRGVLPDVAVPNISVTASYPGASPLEMERLVIEPLEDALDGVASVQRVDATAQNGFAQIVVRLRFGTPLERAQIDAQRAVDDARINLPADLLPPTVERDDPSQIPVLEAAVTSPVLRGRALTTLVDRTILPSLRASNGVGSVRVAGEQRLTFVARPLHAALAALGVTDLDLLRALQGAGDVFAGGVARSGTSQRTIGVRAASDSPEALASIPVPVGSGGSVRTGEVARVSDGVADPLTISSFNGDGAVLLYVTRAQDADTIQTIRSVRKTIESLRATVPLVRIEEYHSDQPFTDAAISGVAQTLFEGIALTVLTMLLFLHAWRNAAVAALAIPSSLFASFVAMRMLGFTMNTLSLMGLSMTIGILVDDSIVIIEAIALARTRGQRGDQAALTGRRELGPAAIAITLVDVAVFSPIALMGGLVGEFMRQFAAVVVIATAFSLFVSLTLTPLLCARWGAIAGRGGRLPWTLRGSWVTASIAHYHATIDGFNRWEARISHRYAMRWLPYAWRRRRWFLCAAAGACAISLVPVATGFIPTEFSPPVTRGEVTVDLREPPGTSIEKTDADARRFAARLLDDDRVANVVTTAGRAFSGTTDVLAANIAEAGIELRDPTSQGDDVARDAKALAWVVPGVAVERTGRGMGGAAPVVYTIAGEGSQLPLAAARLSDLLRSDALLDDVRRSDVGVAPHLDVRIDNERALLLGVNADDAAQTARIETGGALATRTRTASGLIDVTLRGDAAARGGWDDAVEATVRSNSGVLVPVRSLLTLNARDEPLAIERENRRRIVSISANPRDGVPVGEAVAPVAGRIASVLPPGTRVERRGDLEQFEQTIANMGAALGLSLLFVYAILAVLYRSYRLPLVVMATVPLASVGAFGALAVLNALQRAFPHAGLFASQTLNLYSLLGVVALVGLVAKNGILMVEFAEREARRGADPFAAMQAAALRRFRPIVMTTCAMVCGMLPLALGYSAGAEYRKALGSVVIGGLVSSLALTLFIVPIVYLLSRAQKTNADAAYAAPALSGEFSNLVT